MKKIFSFIIFLFASILFLKIPAQQVLAADECRIEITETNEVLANEEFTVKLQSPPSGTFLTTDNDNVFEVFIDGINNVYHDKKEHSQGVGGYVLSAHNETTAEFNLSLPAVKDVNGEAIDGVYSLVANVQYRKAKWGIGGFGIKTEAKHATCRIDVTVKSDGNLENAVEFREPSLTETNSKITPLNPELKFPYRLDSDKMYGISKGVIISFHGLIPEYKYRACLHSDFEKRCMASNKFQIEDLQADEKGELLYPVPFCGNGKDSLKTAITNVIEDIDDIEDLEDIPSIGDIQCDKGDYFHEGSTYKITLFTADYDSGPIASANFYVWHVFPDLEISGYQLDEDGFRLKESPTTENIFYKFLEKSSNGQINNIPGAREKLNAKFEVDNPLELNLAAVIKNKNRNDYQIVVERADKNHKASKCYRLYGTNIDQTSSQTVRFYGTDVGGNQALGPLPPGLYNIYINKQINRGDTSNGSCQGGISYYKIPLSVERDKNNASVTRAIIDASEIQVDPNQEEIRSALDANTTNLPCVEGKDANNENVTIDPEDDDDTKISKLTSIVECTRYGTAIGSFGTDPLGFINSVGTWLFRMGAIVALAMIMYAGFQFQTSRGDKEKIGKAREMLTSAITGLIFIVLAVSILQIIGIDILKIPGFTRGTPTTQEAGSGGGNG